jgi:hypothetical protein
MKLEKREITLNEKETLTDMLFFEEYLAAAYRTAAEKVDAKEARCLLLEHAKELEKYIRCLQEGLQKTPKM